ncbi:hypothetical protein DV515_00009151, partial [Chloebia gouldiae]
MAKSMWYDCQPWSPDNSSKFILISASDPATRTIKLLRLNLLQKGTVTSTKARLCSFASRYSILLHKEFAFGWPPGGGWSHGAGPSLRRSRHEMAPWRLAPPPRLK